MDAALELHPKESTSGLESSIAIAVACVRISLDRFVNLVPMHGHISRGYNANPHLVAFDPCDHHADVVTDVDFLIDVAG